MYIENREQAYVAFRVMGKHTIVGFVFYNGYPWFKCSCGEMISGDHNDAF